MDLWISAHLPPLMRVIIIKRKETANPLKIIALAYCSEWNINTHIDGFFLKVGYCLVS
jgi:hypothetical protein